jgi:hypothetical protein
MQERFPVAAARDSESGACSARCACRTCPYACVRTLAACVRTLAACVRKRAACVRTACCTGSICIHDCTVPARLSVHGRSSAPRPREGTPGYGPATKACTHGRSRTARDKRRDSGIVTITEKHYQIYCSPKHVPETCPGDQEQEQRRSCKKQILLGSRWSLPFFGSKDQPAVPLLPGPSSSPQSHPSNSFRCRPDEHAETTSGPPRGT